MANRSEVIARIDAETDRIVAAEPAGRRSRIVALMALGAKPKLAGLLALFTGGLEAGVDAWAFALTLEAKRYERDFGADDGPRSIRGTFGG